MAWHAFRCSGIDFIACPTLNIAVKVAETEKHIKKNETKIVTAVKSITEK